jgi:hypothetical protein
MCDCKKKSTEDMVSSSDKVTHCEIFHSMELPTNKNLQICKEWCKTSLRPDSTDRDVMMWMNKRNNCKLEFAKKR